MPTLQLMAPMTLCHHFRLRLPPGQRPHYPQETAGPLLRAAVRGRRPLVCRRLQDPPGRRGHRRRQDCGGGGAQEVEGCVRGGETAEITIE